LTNIRKLRLLVEHQGTLRRFCKLLFDRVDASVYLIPYAREGRFYFGGRAFEEDQVEQTFNFKEQRQSGDDRLPKLSIHETGQVHVQVGRDNRAGPLRIPPLTTWRGEHAATITADTLAGLAVFDGQPRTQGAERDHVIPVESDRVESGRLAIYLNGKENVFATHCGIVLTLTRPTLKNPLYLGIRPFAQDPLGDGTGNDGVTVIAGWTPAQALSPASAPFLYIRGE
jgi:hypothetical protein